jgi:NitT/TauT family transport system substrate-binding protein
MLNRVAKTYFLVVLCFSFAQDVRAESPIKFVMDWLFDGPQAIWTVAGQSRCFPDKGLNVSIDRGFGSGDTISKIASGAYDIGVADFGAIVRYNAEHPGNRVLTVFIVSELSGTSVAVLKSSGITKPKDLEGKKIASPQGDASRVMFPAFAKQNGVDASKIEWVTVAPKLRQAMLVQGQADAVAGHSFTVIEGLKELGVKPDDMLVMSYSKYGVEVPGNSVIVRPDWAVAHKKELQAFLQCAVYGIKGTISNPQQATETLKPYNSMIDPKAEVAGLEYSTATAVLTPYVKEHGLSVVDPARLERSIAIVADTIQVPPPSLGDVWTGDYLPPKSELMLSN